MWNDWNKPGSVVKRKRLTHGGNQLQLGQVQSDISPAAGETIGERLKRLRLDRGFSQRELAAPGVSYAYISRIEAGTRTLGEGPAPPRGEARRVRRLSRDRLGSRCGREPASFGSRTSSSRSASARPRESSRRCAVRSTRRSTAGDRNAVLRARVSLASLALERDAFADAATLLEAAVAGEAFSAIDRFDIFANLGRAYAESGHPERAAELFQECIAAVEELGGDPSVEARYATLLSYALTDMGEIARAEEVVRHALERTKDTSDPYMRVRLYWSIARLAHAEGRDSVALTNVRKAIALLQATDDTFHLARAHILAAGITLGRENADDAENHLVLAENLLGTSTTPQDTLYITQSRARLALLRHEAENAAAPRPRGTGAQPRVAAGRAKGSRCYALADALAMSGDVTAADTAYGQAVELLESGGRWRDASAACRAWGRLLREHGRETQALDVLDKAAELGMRAAPEAAHAQELTVDVAVKPRGPYSLALSARLSSDATRTFRDGLFTAVVDVDGAAELARAWQSPDGTVSIRANSAARAPRGCAGCSRSTTTTPTFSGASATTRCSARLAGAPRPAAGTGRDRRAGAAPRVLRPADRGEARARGSSRRSSGRSAQRAASGCMSRRRRATSRALAPTQLRALGLAREARRALVRICRAIELERLHDVPTDAVARAPRARAGPRAVVGRGRLPRGSRPLRVRPRRRPRAREAAARAARTAGRRLGDRGAARAVRRVGRARERLPARRLSRGLVPVNERAPRSVLRAWREEDRDPRRRPIGEALLSGLLSSGWSDDRRHDPPEGARPSCASGTASRRRCRTPTRCGARDSSSSR